MTKDDIVRMARQAGAVFPADGSWHQFDTETLEAFAFLVAAAEREECAKLCEAGQLIDYPTVFERAAINKCATAIRARGNK